MSNERTIVFYIPDALDGVGGVQMLVVNLTREFADQCYSDTKVIVYCPPDSFVAGELSRMQNPRISVRYWSKYSCNLPSDALLVVWAGYKTAARFRSSNPFVLVWCVAPGQSFSHFMETGSRLPPIRSYMERKCRATLSFLAKRNGIACMDRENLTVIRKLAGAQLDLPYLPIVVPSARNRFLDGSHRQRQSGPLRVAWIGRGSVNWKVIPLVRMLQTAALPPEGISLSIFTDTKEKYETMLAENAPPNVAITFRFGVTGEDLRSELASDYDLNLGMGLAVLEGASVGVPSIFVAPQSDMRRLPFWQWVYDRYEGDFGYADWQLQTSRPLNLIQFADNRAQWQVISNRCHDYVSAYHSPHVVAEKLGSWDSKARLASYLGSHGWLFRLAGMLQRNPKP